MSNPELTYGLTCNICHCRLQRTIITPSNSHVDIYCSNCDAFLGHLWYSDFMSPTGKHINEILQVAEEKHSDVE